MERNQRATRVDEEDRATTSDEAAEAPPLSPPEYPNVSVDQSVPEAAPPKPVATEPDSATDYLRSILAVTNLSAEQFIATAPAPTVPTSQLDCPAPTPTAAINAAESDSSPPPANDGGSETGQPPPAAHPPPAPRENNDAALAGALKRAGMNSLAGVFTHKAGQSVWLTGTRMPALDPSETGFVWVPKAEKKKTPAAPPPTTVPAPPQEISAKNLEAPVVPPPPEPVSAVVQEPQSPEPAAEKLAPGPLAQAFKKRAGNSVWITGYDLPALDPTEMMAPPETSSIAPLTIPPASPVQGIGFTLEPQAKAQSVPPPIPSGLSSEQLDEERQKSFESARYTLERGQFEEALKHYLGTVSLVEQMQEPDTAQLIACLTDLIDVYMLLGEPHEALNASRRLDDLDRSRKKDKNYIIMLLKTAAACERMGNISAAEATYLEAIQLAGDLLPLTDPLHDRLNKAFVATHKKRQQSLALGEVEKQSLLDGRKQERTRALHRRESLKALDSGEKKDGESLVQRLRRLVPQIPQWVDDRIYQSSLMQSNAVLIVLSLILLLCTGATVAMLHFERRAKPAAVQTTLSGVYRSCDGAKSLTFGTKAGCYFNNRGRSCWAAYKTLGGTMQDLIAVLSGCMLNQDELWVELTEAGLRDQDGTVLYGEEAPEFLVAKHMWAYADFATNEYKLKKLYPGDGNKVRSVSALFYSNPFSGKAEPPSIIFKRFSASGNGYTKLTAAGKAWEGEPQWRPGAIHCACLDWCRFFVRGFDRYGQPLTSSYSGEYFNIELKDGVNMNQLQENRAKMKQAGESHLSSLRVFISQGKDIQMAVFLIRRLVPTLLWFCLLAAVLWCAASSANAELTSRRTMLALSGTTCMACVAALAFFYYFAFSSAW